MFSFNLKTSLILRLPRWLSGKEFVSQGGDLGLIPGLERSSGEGTGYPFQYSCLKKSMDNPWSRKELDTTESLSLSLILGLLTNISKMYQHDQIL